MGLHQGHYIDMSAKNIIMKKITVIFICCIYFLLLTNCTPIQQQEEEIWLEATIFGERVPTYSAFPTYIFEVDKNNYLHATSIDWTVTSIDWPNGRIIETAETELSESQIDELKALLNESTDIEPYWNPHGGLFEVKLIYRETEFLFNYGRDLNGQLDEVVTKLLEYSPIDRGVIKGIIEENKMLEESYNN